MKLIIIDYLLWFYKNYLQNNFNLLNKLGKRILYPFYIVGIIILFIPMLFVSIFHYIGEVIMTNIMKIEIVNDVYKAFYNEYHVSIDSSFINDNLVAVDKQYYKLDLKNFISHTNDNTFNMVDKIGKSILNNSVYIDKYKNCSEDELGVIDIEIYSSWIYAIKKEGYDYK